MSVRNIGFLFVTLAGFFDIIHSVDPLSALQRSTFNEAEAWNAVDSDPSTCSRTGYDIGPWWKMDFGVPVPVRGVTIEGKAAAFSIYVGNYSETIGHQAGTNANNLCVTAERGIQVPSPVDEFCSQPLVGRYVSIEVVDPTYYGQLTLCDVRIF